MGEQITPEYLDRMRNPNDPPDFRFSLDGKAVAVEHTHVFRRPRGSQPDSAVRQPLTPQHNLAIERRICHHLTRLLKTIQHQVGSVHVSVTFSSCDEVNKRDEEAIARRLSKLLMDRLATKDAMPIMIYRRELSEISPCLSGVLVSDGWATPAASRATSGCVDEWGLAELEAASTKKAKDLPRYKDCYDACWLLLSAGGAHRAQWIEPSAEAQQEGIRSEFDRIFLVDKQLRTVCEIRSRSIAH